MKHEQLYSQLQIVLQSKIEEFNFLNYDTITPEQLWDYCVNKKWRKKNVEELGLHELVSTIFSVTPSEVFTHLNIMESNVVQNGLVAIDLDELEELLGPLKKRL